MATATLDVPSDKQYGMGDGFRAGDYHKQDVQAVIKSIKEKFHDVKIILIGTSRGTISAAYLAASLPELVDSVILTSSVFRINNPYRLENFDYKLIKIPLLFVHHREDNCSSCPYRIADNLSRKFNINLITVHGGLPEKSDPCEPFAAHGFYGKEKETVAAIISWVTGKRESADIK
jgi:pimeloyl-ACP methyl ester carboxylesterase